MSDKTHMTLEQAIESLEKSLAIGDNLMRSKTWSGGNFKSPAIRTVLQTIKAFLEWKAKNEGGGVMSDDLENHAFDRSEYVMLSTNGPMVDRIKEANAKIAELEFALNVEKAFTETQSKMLEGLRDDLSEAHACLKAEKAKSEKIFKERDVLEAHNARLLEALRPLAKVADCFNGNDPLIKDVGIWTQESNFKQATRLTVQDAFRAKQALAATPADALESSRKKHFSNRVLKTFEKCVRFRLDELKSRKNTCGARIKELNIALAAIEAARNAGVEGV